MVRVDRGSRLLLTGRGHVDDLGASLPMGGDDDMAMHGALLTRTSRPAAFLPATHEAAPDERRQSAELRAQPLAFSQELVSSSSRHDFDPVRWKLA